jgi:hypothetical protein
VFGPSRHSWWVARRDLIEETLTRSVIGAFFEVYNNLGYGFLEHLYVMSLERGPKAAFHREICPNKRSNRINPFNPPNQDIPQS